MASKFTKQLEELRALSHEERDGKSTRGNNMRETDRLGACESLQEIKTDLVYRLIESYNEGNDERVFLALELIRPLLEIHKQICPEDSD